jgi:hypothetical protein
VKYWLFSPDFSTTRSQGFNDLENINIFTDTLLPNFAFQVIQSLLGIVQILSVALTGYTHQLIGVFYSRKNLHIECRFWKYDVSFLVVFLQTNNIS